MANDMSAYRHIMDKHHNECTVEYQKLAVRTPRARRAAHAFCTAAIVGHANTSLYEQRV